MTEENAFLPIVQHKSTGAHYQYIGQDTFRNVVTGAEGKVEPDKAAKAFVVNLELSDLANENNCIMELLKLGFIQK